jgi:hypothetical protein
MQAASLHPLEKLRQVENVSALGRPELTGGAERLARWNC